MPPRAVKKSGGGSSGAVKKTAARVSKGKSTPEAVTVTQEEETVIVTEEVKPVEPEVNGSIEDASAKETEEDKGEKLDLEDTELEYDPEEEPIEEEEGDVENEEEEVVEGEGDEGDEVEEGEEEVEEEELVEGTEEVEMIEEIESDGGEDEGEKELEEPEEEKVDAAENEEHHEVLKERRKRKEFEVFVGGLDKETTEDDLKKFFADIGEVVEVRLMKHPGTKKNKGFAFLRFSTVEQAKRAATEMKNPVIKGKQCGVSPCQDNDTLFLGNICKTWTKEHLKTTLKQYGVENIEELSLVEDGNNEGLNRGFAFLEFPSRKEAMHAYRCLRKRDVAFGVDRPAKVSFADPFIEPSDEVMAQVKTVFIDGLPVSWDEEPLRDHLKKFGVIEKIELARNMPSARRRDFGFVSFDTHDAAVKCAETINNSELGEGDKKVKVRARLSRPIQKPPRKTSRRPDYVRPEKAISRVTRPSWGRSQPYRDLGQSSRPVSSRTLVGSRGLQRPVDLKSRRPLARTGERIRDLPPASRSYERRPPVDPYPKAASKRDVMRREVIPRSRAPVEYPSRDLMDRRPLYREDYAIQAPSYEDEVPRSAARSATRRSYDEEGYGRRIERPISMYREGRDYDSISGSKRPYAAIDDVPPRYAEVNARQARPRLDYGVNEGSDYSSYGERLRSTTGYGSSRSSYSGQESNPGYSSRYGSTRSSDVRGMNSSGYSDSSYVSRSNIGSGSSSYPSLYSSRSAGGSGYLGSGGSGSYY